MSACAQAGTMPDSFYFAFGSEYIMEKSGARVTISYRKAWGDAQRPPEERFGEGERSSVPVPGVEAERIWAAIAALDRRIYRQPADSDFEPTPPNMRHTESLQWIVNGETIAAWSHGYKFLKADLRGPLARIAEGMREAYDKASAK